MALNYWPSGDRGRGAGGDVELREDEDHHAHFSVTAAGHPAVAGIKLEYPDREENREAPSGAIPNFSRLRRVTFQPEGDAERQLKAWVHRITPDEDSESIAGILRVHNNGETEQFDLKLSTGQVIVPIDPGACRIEITLSGTDDPRSEGSF